MAFLLQHEPLSAADELLRCERALSVARRSVVDGHLGALACGDRPAPTALEELDRAEHAVVEARRRVRLAGREEPRLLPFDGEDVGPDPALAVMDRATIVVSWVFVLVALFALV